MAAEVHFVQAGDAPILIGSGDGALSCACGNTLIEGYRPGAVSGHRHPVRALRRGDGNAAAARQAQCRRLGVIAAEPSSEPRTDAMTVPAGVAVIGRAERDRLAALFRPANASLAGLSGLDGAAG